MLSIDSIGLLQPIVLHRPGTGLGVTLIFGRSRLEACRRLKHRTILCRVVNGVPAGIEDWCARAALDENLIRRNQFQTADPNVVSLIDRKRSLGATAAAVG
jgi:ParB-like chromosome segregation protein Spo0J